MERIVLDKSLDSGFKFEIAARPGGENIRKCFSCGTCTAGCPVFQVEQRYNPRRIIRMILLGLRERVLSSKTIWLCAQCNTCTAHCPQQVNFSSIMTVLRKMAVAEGHAPERLLEKINIIGTLTQELRRDCILTLLEDTALDEERIKQAVRAASTALRGDAPCAQ
jgi:heterodisulfide reductase subunit C